MKKSNIPPFPPLAKAYTASGAHTMVSGGSAMTITHIHPEYASPEERLEKLKDTKNICLALLRNMNTSTPKRGA